MSSSISHLTHKLPKITWDSTLSLDLKHPTLFLLENCKNTPHFLQILSQSFRQNLITQTFPMSRLLHFTTVSDPSLLPFAVLLFKHFTPKPNLFVYNLMLSALSHSAHQTNRIYKSMLSDGIYPNQQILIALIKSLGGFLNGIMIQCHVVVFGLHEDVYLQNSVMKMYFDCGQLEMARKVFEGMGERDLVSYNIMICGYARNGCVSEALGVLRDMRVVGVECDKYTITSLLGICGHARYLRECKSIHSWVVRRNGVGGLDLNLGNVFLSTYEKCGDLRGAIRLFERIESKDVVSWNTMIAGFANKGDMEVALNFFRRMTERNVVSWNTLLSGYAEIRSWKTVMNLFEDMLVEGVKPDEVTIIILIGTFSDLGVLKHGKCAHGRVIKNFIRLNCFVSSALVDMYCKCGSVEKSLLVFRSASYKDVPLWTAVIMGLAFHGHGIKALEMFQEMQNEGLKPNKITFITILTACSHAGLVDEGCQIFERMNEKYGIKPGVEHYGCLVDLLARAGRLKEAENVIRKMPFTPSRSMWGAILSACKDQGQTELAYNASNELLKLQPDDEVGYVSLANIYASGGSWNNSNSIRRTMDRQCLKKTPGCSSIFVDSINHEFFASDDKHMRSTEIYSTLKGLVKESRYLEENISVYSEIV